jgi:hypothetical protein
MDIEIRKDDLHVTRHHNHETATLEDGQIRLSVESFGLSANNITYAVMGDLMNYWEFFPVRVEEDRDQWGRMPVWGLASVLESRVSDVAVGRRVFGYFAFASELIVTPGRHDDSGFSDVVPHRNDLTSVYNRYAYVDSDPLYDPAREGLMMLLRPLFMTSFVVDDFLGDHDLFGANTAVISSASSKTAMGAAFLLQERHHVTVIGLTSPANVEFTESLGCYDDVLSYDQVAELPITDSIYLDVAGRRDLTRKVHQHFDGALAYSMIVGDTHWDAPDEGGELIGPRPTLLFAPVQITKRRREWGRDVFENNLGAAWHRFGEFVDSWLVQQPVVGPEELERTYQDLLTGNVDPAVGYIGRFVDAPTTS